MKRSKKKTGNEEVLNLVKSPLEYDVSREVFDETLNNLIKENTIKSKTIRNRVCLSLAKEQQEVSIDSQPDAVT